ncbi:ATP-binding protein [Desulfovibrio inopinatus]|uniref:ATP-binding protein n=1 Tax=Desulfovibrio inopinatus TaxID=102109 RepID=UPI000688BE8B|nr:ATP-binding protein [Desulfovibrio inopinatus]
MLELLEENRRLRLLLQESQPESVSRCPVGDTDDKGLYRQLVEHQTELVVKINLRGEIQYANPSFCRLFGKSQSQLLGRQFLALIHKDDQQEVSRSIKTVFSAPHHTYVEQRAQTLNGWRWLAWSNRALLDKENHVTAMMAVGRDITQRKHMQEMLERRVNELLSINALSVRVGSSLAMFQVMDGGFGEIVAAINPDLAFLFLVKNGVLCLEKNHAPSNPTLQLALSNPKVPHALSPFLDIDQEPVYFRYLHENSTHSDLQTLLPGITSLAIFPIPFGESIGGVLGFGFRSPYDFDESKTFLESIVLVYANAIHNALLHGQLKRYSDHLERSRERLQYILDAVPFGVLFISKQKSILHANTAALNIMGYDNEQELIGKYCHETLCPSSSSDSPVADNHQSSDLAERTLIARDGHVIHIIKSVIPVQIEDEDILLEAFVDISEIKQTRDELMQVREELEQRVQSRTRELREANRRLLEIDRLKSALLNTVSHDLRTPLTSVMGFAKLIRRDFIRYFKELANSDRLQRKGEQISSNLDIILREGERLTRLINDFLDLSKIESGAAKWNDVNINIYALISDVADSFRSAFLEKPKLDLIVDINESLPNVRADPDRVTQVLTNLLGNALKFTDEGEVRIAARLRANRLRISVSDTGPGIPKPDLDRIFDKFYQVESNTLGTQPKGTGMGLAICRNIIEHYHGSITVESQPGQGACFTFELPCLS